ncbi:MAG: hypothetical protein MJE77_17045 [Proteobacteria bacterium]|nr:hypothetical protein [Pseudomonadota bacterium]
MLRINPFLLAIYLACGNDSMDGGLTIGDVAFADPELQECFEQDTFGFRGEWDVSLVEQLECSMPAHDIRDLTGIEVLVGLKFLSVVESKELGSLTPLLQLPSLIDLELRKSNVGHDDLAIIAQLTRLEWLNLDFVNDLGDVTSLNRLVHMKSINLQGSGVTAGIASFVSMTRLVQGFFSSNPDSPCEDLSILRAAFPDALIWPVEPQPGITCAE